MTSPNNHVNSNEMSADRKLTTNTFRPFSPYRLHLISLNGELYDKPEGTYTKEKVFTGEINNIYSVNCSVSLLYLLALFFVYFILRNKMRRHMREHYSSIKCFH